MKKLHSLSLISLALTLTFAACGGSGSGNNGSTDSTMANDTTVANTANSNEEKLEANKKMVTDFYQSFFGDKDSTALDKYVADDIKQHSPMLQDGKVWLKHTLQPFLSNPHMQKTKIDIKHVAADGDMVWLLVKDVAPNGKEFARVDIFRVENGKIAESWKVSEPVPAKSANKNGMF